MEIKSNIIELHIFRRRKNKSGVEYLLLKRAPEEIYPFLWQMVSGGIHETETAISAAKRELKEETGLKYSKMWVVPLVNSFYNPADDTVNMIPVFVCEVDKNSKVKISAEHTEYIWVEYKDAKKLLAWQGQRNALKIIQRYFTNKDERLKYVEVS